jgi:hypothetical protein
VVLFFGGADFFFPEVFQGHDGVFFDHSWACVPHYFEDFLPHFGFVAVDLALGTYAFVVAERAFVQAVMGVFEQIGAIGAKLFSAGVLVMAVKPDHYRDCGLFFFDGIFAHTTKIPQNGDQGKLF